MTFAIDPAWSFRIFLDKLYDYYTGGGVQSTGRRLNVIRLWLSMAGRSRAISSLEQIEKEFGKGKIAEAVGISHRTWTDLKAFARGLPNDAPVAKAPVKAFVSYKWESEEHAAWVKKLATGLRARGIAAILDQWEVKFGESFTDYMQEHIATADVMLFVITPSAVDAAEAPKGQRRGSKVRGPNDECSANGRRHKNHRNLSFRHSAAALSSGSSIRRFSQRRRIRNILAKSC